MAVAGIQQRTRPSFIAITSPFDCEGLQPTCLPVGVFVRILGSGFGRRWRGWRSRRLGGRALDADAAGAPAGVSAMAGEAALALRPSVFTLSLLFPAPALARVVSIAHEDGPFPVLAGCPEASIFQAFDEVNVRGPCSSATPVRTRLAQKTHWPAAATSVASPLKPTRAAAIAMAKNPVAQETMVAPPSCVRPSPPLHTSADEGCSAHAGANGRAARARAPCGASARIVQIPAVR